MQWVVVPQWVRALGLTSHRTNASPAGQERTPRASPAMGVRSGSERGGRPRDGAPTSVEAWTAGSPPRDRGTSRRCASAGRPQSWVRYGKGAGHHRRAIQFSNAIPMRASACIGWAANRRQAAAMLVWPAHLKSPMAVLRSVAITCGILPPRTWERSSSKVTSRTQCDLFSIAQ